MTETIKMLPWRPERAPDFRSINEEWIEQMFAIEEADRWLLNDPEGTIIQRGGQIWFAATEPLGIVGTCALLIQEPNVVELTKMGVLQKARGLGVGDALLAHVLNAARGMQPELLYLLTNRRCEAAIHLYLRHGFVHCDEVMRRYGSEYQRSNVAMRWASDGP